MLMLFFISVLLFFLITVYSNANQYFDYMIKSKGSSIDLNSSQSSLLVLLINLNSLKNNDLLELLTNSGKNDFKSIGETLTMMLTDLVRRPNYIYFLRIDVQTIYIYTS